jgi:hypothetical protein
MAVAEKDNEKNGLLFTEPIRGLKRVVSDGFYGASYIPDQSGQCSRSWD